MALIANHIKQLTRLRLLQELKATSFAARPYATDLGNSAPSPSEGGQGHSRDEADATYDNNIMDNLKETQGKAGTASGGTKGADVKSPLSADGKGDAGDDRGSTHTVGSATHKAPSNANPSVSTSAEGDTGRESTTEKVGSAQRGRGQPPRHM